MTHQLLKKEQDALDKFYYLLTNLSNGFVVSIPDEPFLVISVSDTDPQLHAQPAPGSSKSTNIPSDLLGALCPGGIIRKDANVNGNRVISCSNASKNSVVLVYPYYRLDAFRTIFSLDEKYKNTPLQYLEMRNLVDNLSSKGLQEIFKRRVSISTDKVFLGAALCGNCKFIGGPTVNKFANAIVFYLSLFDSEKNHIDLLV